MPFIPQLSNAPQMRQNAISGLTSSIADAVSKFAAGYNKMKQTEGAFAASAKLADGIASAPEVSAVMKPEEIAQFKASVAPTAEEKANPAAYEARFNNQIVTFAELIKTRQEEAKSQKTAQSIADLAGPRGAPASSALAGVPLQSAQNAPNGTPFDAYNNMISSAVPQATPAAPEQYPASADYRPAATEYPELFKRAIEKGDENITSGLEARQSFYEKALPTKDTLTDELKRARIAKIFSDMEQGNAKLDQNKAALAYKKQADAAKQGSVEEKAWLEATRLALSGELGKANLFIRNAASYGGVTEASLEQFKSNIAKITDPVVSAIPGLAKKEGVVIPEAKDFSKLDPATKNNMYQEAFKAVGNNPTKMKEYIATKGYSNVK